MVRLTLLDPAYTVNTNADVVPPPGVGVKTVTFAVVTLATLAAGTAACKVVAETYVVVSAVPFHLTTEEEMKFVPVTVSVNAEEPFAQLPGVIEPIPGMGLLAV